jgi:uncharacterized damage-inducible protein DinB
LDLSASPGYSNQNTTSLLNQFDDNVKKARQAIEKSSDEDYEVQWFLKLQGKVVFSAPRRVVVRQNISHLSHLRGQMTVYLRLLDVAVPSIYGPTADEKWG